MAMLICRSGADDERPRVLHQRRFGRGGYGGGSRLLGATLSTARAPLRHCPDVVEVRMGGGLMAGVEFAEAGIAAAVADRCWEMGLATRQIGMGETLQVSPPLSITENDLILGCEQLIDAAEEVSKCWPASR